MPSVLALLSKSFFESNMRIGGAVPGLGDVAPLDRYLSTNKRLAVLGAGDALFLVTVRPPDESLWLVAILESPVFEQTLWRSPGANQVPVTDVTDAASLLVFDNGKPLSTTPGRLGMSLQTPRVLTSGDVDLIRARVAPALAAAPTATATPTPNKPGAPRGVLDGPAAERDRLIRALRVTPDDVNLRERAARACIRAEQPARVVELLAGHFIHLNAHDVGPLPCLCRACLDAEKHAASTDGTEFVRDFAIASGRVLYFWLPSDLLDERARVAGSVASSLRHRFHGANR